MITPGPWKYDPRKAQMIAPETMFGDVKTGELIFECRCGPSLPDGQLMAAAPDMLAALRNVNKLISEAAMTGFNCKDGDWAERLFASQQVTSAAIRKANGD